MTETNRFAPLPSLQAGDGNDLCIVASIVNLPQIEIVHGQIFSRHLLRTVHERARALCKAYGGTAALSGPHLLCVFDTDAKGLSSDRDVAFPVAISRMLASIGDQAIVFGRATAFPVVEIHVAYCDGRPLDIDSVGSSRVISGFPGGQWREQFVVDTQTASEIFVSMESGRLDFAFEPICCADGSGAVVWREAVLCETGGSGSGPRQIGSRIASLERIGMVRRLDRWVAESLMARLTEDPQARLGCNISAQSAVLDAWWTSAIHALNADPAVASRMTVEITETWSIEDPVATRAFCRALSESGCRIALDDVDSQDDHLLKKIGADIDIVKVDASVMLDARFSDHGRTRLEEIIGIAKEYGDVVVGGIETERDEDIARECGATHLQGYLFAR
ncbi:hypothetical protein CY652_20650 [Burkholderia sp. WAC0059]|uniref:EAL domain-containing protein n=1 Tax=Burkholderia sp. WAC0059 TaxID=2066022 RepID=UPI000C7F256D|nr:EAL domain-containing protein [Burkholderia sp. WAC0059]PLZ00547.1 hypothetical protein CY652_20650 [Burkholderia sp. WAC0059]